MTNSSSTADQNIAGWKKWVNRGYDGQYVVPLPKNEKGPITKGWESKVWTNGQLGAKAKAGWELGLRTKGFPALDIDCDNPGTVIGILDFLKNMGWLDNTMIRERGDVDRCAVIWRTDTPHPKAKRRYEIVGTGEQFVLEFLGDGQQIKVWGGHPDTDAAWFDVADVRAPGDLAELPYAPNVMLDAIEEYFDGQIKRLAKSSGQGQRRAGASGAPTGERADAARIEAVLNTLSNDASTFGDYDTFINRVLMPVYGASGGEDWGYEIFRAFAQSGEYDGVNTDAWCEDKWRSCHGAGVSVGMQELRGTATEFGGDQGRQAAVRDAMSLGADMSDALGKQGMTPDAPGSNGRSAVFKPDELTREGQAQASPSKAAERWLGSEDIPDYTRNQHLDGAIRGLVLHKPTEQIYARGTLAKVGRAGFDGAGRILHAQFRGDTALNRRVPPKTPGGTATVKRVPVAEHLKESDGLLRVDGLGYAPGLPEVYKGPDGTLIYNRWMPTDEMVKHVGHGSRNGNAAVPRLEDTELGQVAYKLFELSGEKNWRELWGYFLDWIAFVVCAPANKPAYHWFLSTQAQGTGKSLIAHAISELVGVSNANMLEEGRLGDTFNEYLMNKFIFVDEMMAVVANVYGKVQRNKYQMIKSQLVPGGYIFVNAKHEPITKALNTSAWMMLSNHGASALGVEPDDRRIVIVESSARREDTDAETDALVHGVYKDKDRWRDETTAACAARCRAVWGDPNERWRWEQFTGGAAPSTSRKEEVVEASLGPIAQAALEAWQDGMVGAVASFQEVRDAIKSRQRVSESVKTQVETQQVLEAALREIGAAYVGRKVKSVKMGWPVPVRPWVFPGIDAGAPQREMYATGAEYRTDAARWREKVGAASNSWIYKLRGVPDKTNE